MHFSMLLLAKLCGLAVIAASPVALPSTESTSSQRYGPEIKKWFNDHTSQLQILETTVSPKNQTIDWIPANSQGQIAVSPPSRSTGPGSGRVYAVPELQIAGAQRGPKGTVPVLRKDLNSINYERPLPEFLNKTSTRTASSKKRSTESAEAYEGHHYGSSQQNIDNLGTCGSINFWDPFVQDSSDFSLLQNGVINTVSTEQTVESGWQKYQDIYGDTNPHFFTYYTTSAYQSTGDNEGCYNRDCQGWVQVSNSVFPGTVLSNPSQIGGQQTVISLCSQLYQGNWWIEFNGEWIGYYPGSLYSSKGDLGNKGTTIGWWGEVYDDGTDPDGTTTDMGSGQFPSSGEAAFVENLNVQNLDGSTVDYAGNNIDEDQPNWYQIETHWSSGTSRGSYALIGGPGSG